MRRSGVLLMATCVLGSMGCLERKGAPVGPEIGFGQVIEIGGGVGDVDILFVIDNSRSMAQEQTNLATQIPALVRDLASPPDRDADGSPDWNPVELMRIGIVTTDTGIGSTEITGSNCVPNGEDGQLRGGVFEWATGSEDPQAFADRVGATVSTLGIAGCNFEQPLEAAARAIGHADATGFPDPDRLFAVIVVSDEEDCSVDDDDAFFGAITNETLNVHCSRNADLLTPLPELLDRIRGDRGPNDFLFAAITGIPRDFGIDATPEEILAHPLMQYTETGAPPRLTPACQFTDASGVDLGEAYPARRAVELATLVPDSIVTTICTDDFGPAITEVAERLGARVGGLCLARALPEEEIATACSVNVLLPSGVTCDSFDAYTLLRSVDGQERCSIAQVSEGSGEEGFFYDPSRDGCPQLVLTEGAIAPVGSDVTAECFFPVLKELGEQCARWSQCETEYCDPITQLCAEAPVVAPGTDPPLGG